MPTKQRRLVRLLREHEYDLVDLEEDEVEESDEFFDDPEDEFISSIDDWVTESGTWSPTSYRHFSLWLAGFSALLADHYFNFLKDAGDEAGVLSIEHFDELLLHLPEKLPLTPLVKPAQQGLLIDRYRSSSLRYAGRVRADLTNLLGYDLLRGARVSETVDSLVAHGGPMGRVIMEGGRTEDIAEGLFLRYRSWAQRLVRTELTTAYTAQSREARRQLDAALGRDVLLKKWFASSDACPNCLLVHDQTVSEYDYFQTPFGPISDPPLHPNCRCVAIPWRKTWGSLV